MGVWKVVEKNVEEAIFTVYAIWQLFFRLAVVWSHILNAIYQKESVFQLNLIWKESSLHA